MATDSVSVVLTYRATADYENIRKNCVACLLAGEINGAPLLHFGRTRNILKSLRDRNAVKYDQPMINDFSWMLSRSEGSTYVYYGRNLITSTVVVIHLCEGSTNIYSLLAEIVLSGRMEILAALGITPPPLPPSYSITIH
jgi:hypothetical protein